MLNSIRCLKYLEDLLSVRVYPKISGLPTWSENCKWHTSLPLSAVISILC